MTDRYSRFGMQKTWSSLLKDIPNPAKTSAVRRVIL